MTTKRVKRLNSLLKEVISEVIHNDVRNPDVGHFVSISEVDISKDLQHAKVFISVIGTDEEREKTLQALQSAAGFISVHASKKVSLRFFPSLNFKLDHTVDDQMNIDSILKKIHEEESHRETKDSE